MKRHPSLRNLSSDHHQALVQAHRLQLAAVTADEIRQKHILEFLQFWDEHAQPHFCEEEQALLPFFARWGDLNQEPIHQMLRDHAMIRGFVVRLQAGGDAEKYCRDIGSLLEAHVRLEERTIFPLIESSLPEEALAELPAVLKAWHDQNQANDTLKEEKMTTNGSRPGVQSESGSTLPGANLQTHKMPGHWLLARLGKKVLRPGGLEMTRQMLGALDISSSDSVVEFAPGLGATAQLALEKDPVSYIAIEREKAAAEIVSEKLGLGKSGSSGREVYVASAAATHLPSARATVVYGEAMLTMQTPEMKRNIVAEAARLLRAGGRYGIHELSLLPDDLDENAQNEISMALGGAIHVGARPLRIREWRELLEGCGLKVEAEFRAPMELLEPGRLLADEGVSGALHIIWNALHDEEALTRVREMRGVFRKYRDNLGAVALVARKQ